MSLIKNIIHWLIYQIPLNYFMNYHIYEFRNKIEMKIFKLGLKINKNFKKISKNKYW